jgi:predicted XRE-type DNA-binding protein
MNAERKMKTQVMEAIREWMEHYHLTQAQAAERLGLYQQQVSEIVLLRSRYSLGRLLRAWEATEGDYTFKVFRTEPGYYHDIDDAYLHAD